MLRDPNLGGGSGVKHTNLRPPPHLDRSPGYGVLKGVLRGGEIVNGVAVEERGDQHVRPRPASRPLPSDRVEASGFGGSERGGGCCRASGFRGHEG